MKTSANGIRVIQYFESCHLDAYPDPATGGDPWTIGWGHTGPEVKPGLHWHQSQADAALAKDLERFEAGVTAACKIPPTQGQFDALVSFSFNVGLGNLQKSTLLKKFNASDTKAACSEFVKWNKAAGKVMRGLTRRRAAEAALFSGFTGDSAIAAGKAAA